ncbi:polyphosphate kinase 1 [Halomicrobium sp. HM KBTZ05]|uniref:polyphosphate kinase 1 n=1 Tax=Halomicrobium sp. HM KBTZ05 TaxID=3242663 RepID=UPI00355682B0
MDGDRDQDGVGIEPFEPDDVDLADPSLYLNRELSELEFQKRVLHEAEDERTPLLERVRFLSIFTRNIDEFVMKRVGGLKQQIEAGVTDRTPDGRTPLEQWREIHDELRPMLAAQTACYRETIRPALADAGIEILDYSALAADERARLRTYFEDSVLPTLTPLSFDPAHPFPFISNRSLSLAIVTRQSPGEELTFTRVKIPPNRPRLVELEAGARYVPIEAVIRNNLDLLLPNVEIVDTALFRLTRNAEVRRDEEIAEDLIDMIEEVLEQRRFASVVRLEIEADAHTFARETLQEQLELDEREIYEREGPLDYREFDRLVDLDRPALQRDAWTPRPHPQLTATDRTAIGEHTTKHQSVFERVGETDILLHHPYHDFTQTVQSFLHEAATDPDVLAVKAAIYRTTSDSQVIQSLIDAAENGKQVAVMVELKARFDEQNNLEWVRTLEEHGIHVAYGTIGLKTHTKTALVVREEDDGVELYSHVGTGNYHSETAKGYVDLGLLTADQDIGQDLVTVFNFFTGPSLDEQFRKLLIAPVTMRERFTRYIRREARYAQAGHPARIVVKVNGLEDPAIVEELYRAAMAGVDVDLIVRDICRLRPGVEGVSENVDVYSLVGRFLEHSRIFYFENGAAPDDPAAAETVGDPRYFIGSADWMTRNLDYRVEAVTPVDDPTIRRQLKFVLELTLADNRHVWEMQSDGSYEQRRPGDESAISTQDVLMEQTRAAASQDEPVAGLIEPYPIDGDLLVEAGPPRSTDTSEVDGDDTEVTNDPEAQLPSETDGGSPRILDRHEDRWYEPDSRTYEYAVRTPDGQRVYRKTADGAASALRQYYE